MKKIIYCLSVLCLISCGGESSEDLVLDEVNNNVLANFQLQYQLEGDSSKSYKEGEDLINVDYGFYKQSEKTLQINLSRSGEQQTRVELRRYPNFTLSDESKIEVALKMSPSTLEEITFMQLHRKENYSVKPPVRVVKINNKSIGGVDYENYIVIVYYSENDGYSYYPIAEMGSDFNNYRLELENYELFFYINDSLVWSKNVYELKDYDLYHKTGAYLSGSKLSYGSVTLDYNLINIK